MCTNQKLNIFSRTDRLRIEEETSKIHEDMKRVEKKTQQGWTFCWSHHIAVEKLHPSVKIQTDRFWWNSTLSPGASPYVSFLLPLTCIKYTSSWAHTRSRIWLIQQGTWSHRNDRTCSSLHRCRFRHCRRCRSWEIQQRWPKWEQSLFSCFSSL